MEYAPVAGLMIMTAVPLVGGTTPPCQVEVDDQAFIPVEVTVLKIVWPVVVLLKKINKSSDINFRIFIKDFKLVV